MGFFDDVRLVASLLQRDGRLTYHALQREFGFDAGLLDDLRRELIFREIAVDEQGEGLVWTGVVSYTAPAPDQFASPASSLADLPDMNLASKTSFASEKQPNASQPAATQPPFQVPLPSAMNTIPPRMGQEALTVTSPDAAEAGVSRQMLKAEHRQLTVMFCDLVGSTGLSGELDPEDLREVVRAYQETAADIIEHYEGHIAQYLGDGLLIYFGFPRAHEDDAQRAVYTALELPGAIKRLNTHLEAVYNVRLAMRIGIHTGPVVVGEMGSVDRYENLALGETPNIAARLESLAQPNTVVISAVTAQLVQHRIVLEALGGHQLKGVAEAMALFKAVSRREVEHGEREAALSGGFTALVGRDDEIGLLRRRWEQSKEGQGQVVLVSGEAGLGKSSLADGLRAHVRHEGYSRIAFRCSSYTANSAFYPIIDHLQRAFGWQQDDSDESKLAKLENFLQGMSLPLQASVPLVCTLLSLPLHADHYSALPLTPEQLRRQTQDVLVAILLEETEWQPVLAVWEDLQWADPSTLDLLGILIDQAPTSPILHVLTFRPEFEPPWVLRSHLAPISLNPLSRCQTEAMVAQLAAGKSPPEEMIDLIVTKTDGVPLYVEELTKMLLSSDMVREESDRYELTEPLLSIAIPDTLQGSLMARLDQLNTAKEIAQLGAVLGRTFSYTMLQALAAMEQEDVQQGLSELVQAELLYQRGRPPRATYIFKHSLIQEAAYTSLLRQTRQQIHHRIAQLFETQFLDIIETRPELVAHHYRHSSHTEPAVGYLQRAGRQAAQRAAYAESINHLTTALSLLEALPVTPNRLQQELALQLALATPLMVTRGYGAPAVECAFTRARQLCERLGDTSQLASLLQRGWNLYLIHAELTRAHALGEELLALARSERDDTLRLRATLALGITLYYSGLFAPAQLQLEQGLALYNPNQHRSQHGLQDPYVTALGHLAWLQWLQGYPDHAQQLRTEMLDRARQLAHPNTLAAALIYAVGLSIYLREIQSAHAWAEEAIALGAEHGFAMYWVVASISRGWAIAMQERAKAGIAEMQQGLAVHQGQGAALDRPGLLGLLAEVYGQTGQFETGLRVLAEALEQVDAKGERYFEAELYRRKGVMLLAQSMDSHLEATQCFQKALDIAHRQTAKSWELRTATSLGRLWHQMGKQQEALELLVPIYDWYTEGFDTVDLQEAKSLLAKLDA